jgi:hypothetical protein
MRARGFIQGAFIPLIRLPRAQAPVYKPAQFRALLSVKGCIP